MLRNTPIIKSNYLKALLVFITVLGIGVFTFVSCKQPPEPIRMLDMNTVTTINYNVISSEDDLSINEDVIKLSKNNAHDTERFMIFKNLIEDYESKIFTLAKNDNSFTSDLIMKHTQLTVNFDSFYDATLIKSYTLNISMIDMKGILIGPEHRYEIDKEVLHTLLNSNLIPVSPSLSTIPIVSLSFNNESIELQYEGTWNNLLYLNRYNKESVSMTSNSNNLDFSSVGEAKPILNFETLTPNQVIITTYATDAKDKVITSNTLFPTTNNVDIDIPEKNNSYYIEAVCQWKESPESSYGSITYSFFVDVEVSETYTLLKSNYQPGDLLVIRGDYIDDDLDYTIESDLYNQGLTLQKSGDSYYIFLPLTSKTDLGTYTITITDNDHPELKSIIKADVVYKEFDVQYLETSGSTSTLQNDDNYAQLNEAFARGRLNLHPEKLWDGVFIQPVGGRISTEYGQIRYTNGAENSSRHSGIDFANPTGTDILATQNGYVTLAEPLNITGNTLFIDHGFGIVSQYYHTNEIYVSVGDYVTAGQVVAAVGTTGFSTGPHLHFSMYNNGIYLNPWKFFDEAPF